MLCQIFRIVWPIQRNFLRFTCFSAGSYFIHLRSAVLPIVLSQNILQMIQLLLNAWNLCVMEFEIGQVSLPYNSVDLYRALYVKRFASSPRQISVIQTPLLHSSFYKWHQSLPLRQLL